MHNLYCNKWAAMMLYRDNFAIPHPPKNWALEFRQEAQGCVYQSSARAGTEEGGGWTDQASGV